ncbi:hypothetical protein GCM10027174_00960 [Salinifilum aidingensis]
MATASVRQRTRVAENSTEEGGAPTSAETPPGPDGAGPDGAAGGGRPAVADRGRALRLPCRADPDLWFAETPRELEKAKTLCAECPIKAECLAGALARGEPWGVWGGEILDQGAVIQRKRPRGRPRKHPAPEGAAAPQPRGRDARAA